MLRQGVPAMASDWLGAAAGAAAGAAGATATGAAGGAGGGGTAGGKIPTSVLRVPTARSRSAARCSWACTAAGELLPATSGVAWLPCVAGATLAVAAAAALSLLRISESAAGPMPATVVDVTFGRCGSAAALASADRCAGRAPEAATGALG